MDFQYRVRDPLGNFVQGKLEAVSVEDAAQQLRRDGFAVVELEEDSSSGLLSRRISKRDIIYITNQLAVMVDTGITLSTALEGILKQEKNPALRRVLLDLKSSVEGGDDFSSALVRYPKLFDKTYVALVRASEATGTLGPMLERIANYLRKELETRGKVRSALAYPMVMLFVAIVVTFFLLIYVLPQFTPLFNRQGIKLPVSTVIMMHLSDMLIHHWPWFLVGAIATIVGLVFAKRTPHGTQAWHWLKINFPIIGPMVRKVAISRSVRTLGSMVAAGVPVLDALRLCADVSNNFYYERMWMHVIEQVTSGKQICEGLADNPLFPPMLVQMISTGEATGKLDRVLEKVSIYYDQEVDASIKTTTSLIEPIMISVMGVVVGGIAMSLMLPIFSLSRHAG
ncbi:MAG TPA: type II secretion system F family protein [Pirellulales bacterium]|jgi:type IV pilus assembly protein PilC|nr:type II secretion system F family protein [Pirellulales bacterium]